MKRTPIFSLLLSFLSILTISAQEEASFGIKFSGFVKNDFFVDSRQTICAREGHFLLWPAPEKLDEYGNDINSMFRISPRIVYNSGNVRLALEVEYTQAVYGSNYNEFFIPDQIIPVGNLRALMGVYYFF